MGKPRKSFPEVIQPKELPWWKMAKTPCSQWRGGPGSTLGQETKSSGYTTTRDPVCCS